MNFPASVLKPMNEDEYRGGTSLCGYVNVSYQELVNAFGPPNVKGDPWKCDANWLLVADDENETVCTIYNYKDGVNYLGPEGTPVEQIRDWHVGGFDGQKCVDLVRQALREHAATEDDLRIIRKFDGE